ncbi:MAG TPA: chemotaxis protein CheW [Bryobacteraceae bacterium]|jgi:purine-binding chemotaxis protein CheW
MSGAKRFDWPSVHARLERAQLAIEFPARSKEQLEELYRERAARLARPVVAEAGGVQESILIFRLGSERYAIPVLSIAQIAKRPPVAPAPGMPAEIAGLVQIRGEIRVAWNLARVLGLPENEMSESGAVLLIKTSGGEAGLLVDEVEDVRSVNENQRRPAPERSPLAAWMTEDLVMVLNTEVLLPQAAEEN